MRVVCHTDQAENGRSSHYQRDEAICTSVKVQRHSAWLRGPFHRLDELQTAANEGEKDGRLHPNFTTRELTSGWLVNWISGPAFPTEYYYIGKVLASLILLSCTQRFGKLVLSSSRAV